MNEPNTEPPPPPPEPPKARHPLAWFVFISPVVFLFVAAAIGWGLAWLGGFRSGDVVRAFITLAVSGGVLLCIYLGTVMEAWLHRDSYSAGRVVLWAFCIFVLNAFLSISLLIGGCIIMTSR